MEVKITDYFKVATDEQIRQAAIRPHRAKPAPLIKRPIGRPRKMACSYLVPVLLLLHLASESSASGSGAGVGGSGAKVGGSGAGVGGSGAGSETCK